MNTTTTPTLEEIRAKLIELPDATLEEFAELLHRTHSAADSMLSVLEQKIPETPDKPQVAVLARILAASLLMTKLKELAHE